MVSSLMMVIVYRRTLPEPSIKNGFTRNLLTDVLTVADSVALADVEYYFAGWSGDSCLLASALRSDHLVSIIGSSVLRIEITNPLASAMRYSQITVDSPYFYLADLMGYTIYRGMMNSWHIEANVHAENFFSEYLPVNGALVLRGFNDDKDEYLLVREKMTSDHVVGAGLLQRQIDGLFCTDGMLRYDAQTARIVYTYYYRNQFIVADTLLELAYRANTIDTTHFARIKVSTLSLNHVSTLSAPPLVVNRYVACDGGLLYVNSNLLADNESRDEFNASDAIDVYSLSDGSYEFSFYIPRIEGKRLRHFALHKNSLYVLHGRWLHRYMFARERGKFIVESR